MPGGKNYREIRVGLPSNKRPMSYEDWRKSGSTEQWSSKGIVGDDFMNETHHGDEPNVLFHLRVADHVDTEGKKGLLIDELQSDWHQKGRSTGYKGDIDSAALDQEMKDIVKERSSLVKEFTEYASKNNDAISPEMQKRWNEFKTREDAIEQKRKKAASAVPDAPFKDNWYQLGLKRAIKEAADTGMDRVYLTTGQRQADRYDMSKHISEVRFNGSSLHAYDKNGKMVINQNGVSEDKLADYIGKEAAKKLLEQESKHNIKKLSGLDLKVGGEGMRQYYDKTYKNFLDKYAKQFDARVGETRLPNAAITRDQLSASDMHNMMDNPEFKKILDEEFVRVANEPRITGKVESQGPGQFKVVWSDGTMSGGYSEQGARDRLAIGRSKTPLEKQAWNAALKRFGGEKVYYIDITPKMRESAQKGQSYKDGGAVRMAEGGAVDYESRFNQMLQDHVAGMAEGGAVDYESRFNDMLQKHVQSMAEGGAVNPYNEDPDMSDGGRFIPAPAFADGGAVKSIWTVN